MNDDDDEELIVMPIATLTLAYGLGRDGQPMLTEKMENHQHPEQQVPMVERLGMLAMAQQSATLDVAFAEVGQADGWYRRDSPP